MCVLMSLNKLEPELANHTLIHLHDKDYIYRFSVMDFDSGIQKGMDFPFSKNQDVIEHLRSVDHGIRKIIMEYGKEKNNIDSYRMVSIKEVMNLIEQYSNTFTMTLDDLRNRIKQASHPI